MGDSGHDAAHDRWSRAAARRAPGAGLAAGLARAAPVWFVLADLVLSARTRAKLTNGYSKEPVFSTATTATVLWVAAVLTCVGIALGLRQWLRAGRPASSSRRYSTLAVAVLTVVTGLLWWRWQYDVPRAGWVKGDVFGESENYADQFPVHLLVPVVVSFAAAVIAIVVYVWPARRSAPDNPYRAHGPGVEAPDLNRRDPRR